MGEGGNAAAAAFTAKKGGNKAAYLAAFTPEGKYLGETAIYADKMAVHTWLRGLVVSHPEYMAWTDAEREVQRLGRAAESSVQDRRRLAALYESLGRWGDALALYKRDTYTEALRGSARTARHARDWGAHGEAVARIRLHLERHPVRVDLLVETTYGLVHQRKYAEARNALRAEIHAHDDAPRAAELHFNLGLANWFLDQKDWARFHWMWIWHKRRDDRLAMRGKIAAAAEVMPYANPELGGYKARGNIGTQDIETEHRASCAVYGRLLPFYLAKSWGAPEVAGDEDVDYTSPTALVAKLRDGNRHVAANNKIVAQLEAAGQPAIDALVKALDDDAFGAKGYAGWALGCVIAAGAERTAASDAAMARGLRSDSPYVNALTRSGINKAGIKVASLPSPRPQQGDSDREAVDEDPQSSEEEADPEAISEMTKWVRALVDGNAYRVENNRLVDRLVKQPSAAYVALMAILPDASFKGRGYAAFALGKVLAVLPTERPAAMKLLRQLSQSGEPYVRALARSGLGVAERR